MDKLLYSYGKIHTFMYPIRVRYILGKERIKICNKRKNIKGRIKFKKRYSHKIYYTPVT